MGELKYSEWNRSPVAVHPQVPHGQAGIELVPKGSDVRHWLAEPSHDLCLDVDIHQTTMNVLGLRTEQEGERSCSEAHVGVDVK